MEHRGPDKEGSFVRGPIGLGHRRLSIIDLAAGDQPLCNENGTIWVVYNGEIYNFMELRSALQKKGHTFRTRSDTEVIVHQYEEEGPQCVKKLRGMFALAIWDGRSNQLLLARDRVGVKPLYYTDTGRAFIFASEIKAILQDPSVCRKANLRAVDRFISYGYLPGSETLIEGVFKLPPGHYLLLKNGECSLVEYWDLSFHVFPGWKNFSDAARALEDLLRESVKDHMISDVPVGVLLSGGVDSTGVLRYAAEHSDRPIHTFTIGFENEYFPDERPYARLAAQRFGAFHHEMTITAEDFRDFLFQYCRHMEEPVFEPPAVALYYVAKAAREAGVKVLLSGEGGDEAFGGYQNYRNMLLLERLKRAFGPAKRLLSLGFGGAAKCISPKFERYVPLIRVPLDTYYLSRTATPFSGMNKCKKFLYRESFINDMRGYAPFSPTRELMDKTIGLSHLAKMLYIDTKTWLPDDLLIKADKMTMATSVELRVPLLDYRVLEFAASLPDNYKVGIVGTKRILKRVLSEAIPSEILNRRKTGFPVPYSRWLRSDLYELVQEILLSGQPFICRYLEKASIETLVRGLREADYSREIFCLLVLEILHRAFSLD